MELMWLMLAIVTFIIAVVRSFQHGIFDALYFYGFSVIAIFLFLMRRKQRRYHEKQQDKS
jgi:hypothetical protein